MKVLLKLIFYKVKVLLSWSNEKKLKSNRIFLFYYLKNFKRRNKRQNVQLCEIDVIIPAIERDITTLKYSIESVRRFLLHPISNIFIVSPDSALIKDFCISNKCINVDEASLGLPPKYTITYKINGEDRSGWLYQQLLKLNGDRIANSEYFLILDSDTFFIRPQYFVNNDIMELDCSDEYHVPYFNVFKKIFKVRKTFPLSFVAHYMIFNKKLLGEMKEKIEVLHNKEWYNVIIQSCDYTNLSGFSEYETWGNYLYNFHQNKIRLNYWYNKSISRKEQMEIDDISSKNAHLFKSISLHWYND